MLRRTAKTCQFMQFYRATKSGMRQESGNEITQSDLSGTMNSGLESLQNYTLAAMQNEIEALKAELKKYQKVKKIPLSLNASTFYVIMAAVYADLLLHNSCGYCIAVQCYSCSLNVFVL